MNPNNNYIKAINRFIATAAARADKHADAAFSKNKGLPVIDIQEYNDIWNREYHRQMDILCKAAGLRV